MLPTHSGTVESLYDDYCGLREVLANDPSGLAALERSYPKVLLLAAASHLETLTIESVLALFDQAPSFELRKFVELRTLKRQFHTLFDWEQQKATGFFASFGTECKQRYSVGREKTEGLASAVDAFLQLGGLRNQLVHNNYAEFQLDRTAEEIVDLYKFARSFPGMIRLVVFQEGPSQPS